MPFWHFPDSMTQDLNTMISSCPTFWMIPKKSMPSLTFTPPFRATGGTTPYIGGVEDQRVLAVDADIQKGSV